MKTEDVTVADVVAWVETKDNATAFRFEPAIYEKLLVSRTDSEKQLIAKIQDINKCSWHSALVIYASSWGAYQIMGFNLYGPVCRLDYDISDFLCGCDKINQCDAFVRLKNSMGLMAITPRAMAISGQARLRFALKYNGGAEYAELIKQALIHFGFTVKG